MKLDYLINLFFNQAPITDAGAEWVRLFDYGHYPHKLGLQDFTREGMTQMVNEFTARKTKAGNRWRGVPITIGHRDAPNNKLTHMGEKIGRVLDIALRDDGPWVQVAWNEMGRKNIEEGWAEFPSIEVYVAKNERGFSVPKRFVGIGMVEEPNIPTSEAWTNEADPNNPNNTDNTDMKAIATALGCEENEAAILAAIEALKTKGTEMEADNSKKAATACNEKARADKAEADLLAANEKIITLTAERDAEAQRVIAVNEARRDELITVALNEGRITEAEKPALIIAFNEDFDTAATTLKAKKKKLDTTGITLQREQARTMQLAKNEAQQKLADLATAHAKVKGIDYTLAFNECLRNPDNAALVKAING